MTRTWNGDRLKANMVEIEARSTGRHRRRA